MKARGGLVSAVCFAVGAHGIVLQKQNTGDKALRRSSVSVKAKFPLPFAKSGKKARVGDWQECSPEDGLCNCPGGKVKFGADDKWSEEKEADGSVECSNAVFGDPIFGTLKKCMCMYEPVEHEQASYNCREADPCCIDGSQKCADEYKKPKSWGRTLGNPENLSNYMDDIEFVGELFYSIGCARQIDSAQNMEKGIKDAKKMAEDGASEEDIAKKIAEQQGADESYLREKGAMIWVNDCKKLNAIHLERCPREMCTETRGKQGKIPDFEECKKECELKYTDLDGHCSKQGVELQEILGGRAQGSAKKTKCIEEHCPKIGGQILSASKQEATAADLGAAKQKLCDEQKKAAASNADLDDKGKENLKKIIEADCSACDESMLTTCVNDATSKTTEKTLFDFCRDVYNTWQEYELVDASGQIQR